MDKQTLITYFERMDAALKHETRLCIYGSAVCILLDEPERTSLDVDIAGPYSSVHDADFNNACREAGLPVNPGDDCNTDHIEWIGALRLCLSEPDPATEITLWRGEKLHVATVSIADLIASKLIRYDEIDKADIQYLLLQGRIKIDEVAAAVIRLPSAFAQDVLVRDNLANLKRDYAFWKEGGE